MLIECACDGDLVIRQVEFAYLWWRSHKQSGEGCTCDDVANSLTARCRVRTWYAGLINSQMGGVYLWWSTHRLPGLPPDAPPLQSCPSRNRWTSLHPTGRLSPPLIGTFLCPKRKKLYMRESKGADFNAVVPNFFFFRRPQSYTCRQDSDPSSFKQCIGLCYNLLLIDVCKSKNAYNNCQC